MDRRYIVFYVAGGVLIAWYTAMLVGTIQDNRQRRELHEKSLAIADAVVKAASGIERVRYRKFDPRRLWK